MPTVKNAVFAAATALAYTALPTQVEAEPANVLALHKPTQPDPALEGQQSTLPLSHARQLQTHARKPGPITTYTVNRTDGDTVVFWSGDLRCQPVGERVGSYAEQLPGGNYPALVANCSEGERPMIGHEFFKPWDGYSETLERVRFYQPVYGVNDTDRNQSCEDLRVGPYAVLKVRGALPLVHGVAVASEPCRETVYGAAAPSAVGNPVITASLIAFAAIARTLG
ncbi:hypothetical protein [Caenimonas sp. SL110]|uniref:hypothetical protein n=1 Tax=Caenimonas sp. SL110 TaxID=1450524 RepID=UPI000653D325|nr:hypothetical protein [Caenimonas sp. SL110]